jgi:hypothetical protein
MTTSTAHSSVAARIIVSPFPQVTPVGGAARICPARRTPRAAIGNQPSRSPRNGTARRTTHTNNVFWMNAAVGALATARPLKKRTNGTLPPMTPMTAILDQARRSIARTWARGTTTAASAMRITAATPFLSVV